MYYVLVCSENKGAEQLQSYCAADLHLFFAHAKIRCSHDVAHIFVYVNMYVHVYCFIFFFV